MVVLLLNAFQYFMEGKNKCYICDLLHSTWKEEKSSSAHLSSRTESGKKRSFVQHKIFLHLCHLDGFVSMQGWKPLVCFFHQIWCNFSREKWLWQIMAVLFPLHCLFSFTSFILLQLCSNLTLIHKIVQKSIRDWKKLLSFGCLFWNKSVKLLFMLFIVPHDMKQRAIK